MGIFDFFKRANNDDVIQSKKIKKSRNIKAIHILRADLARLNSVKSGVGYKAINYVISGKDETVISTLVNGQYSKALPLHSVYGKRNHTHERRVLFCDMKPYDVGFITRYGEILTAVFGEDKNHRAGSKHVNPLSGIIFNQIFAGTTKRGNVYHAGRPADAATEVSVDIGIEIIQRAGGTTVDFIDLIYDEPNNWYSTGPETYRSLIDTKALITEHAEHAITAGGRISAKGREAFLRDLSKWDLVSRTPFFEFTIERLSDGSKSVRELAASILRGVPAEKVEPVASEKLKSGTVGQRAAMAELLAGLGSPSALEVLSKHKSKEKAARVIAAIDTALLVDARVADQDAVADDGSSYLAIDGTRVDIPSARSPEPGALDPINAKDRNALQAIIAQENKNIIKKNEEAKRDGLRYRGRTLDGSVIHKIIKALNPNSAEMLRQYHYSYLFSGQGLTWLKSYLERQSEETRVQINFNNIGGIRYLSHSWGTPFFKDNIIEYLESDIGDVRYLEGLDVLRGREITLGWYGNRETVKVSKGTLLRHLLSGGTYGMSNPEDLPKNAYWPYIASNLNIIDEALGLVPPKGVKLSAIEAIRYLAILPKTPARYFGPLLEAATGKTKSGRAEARAMLEGVSDVENRLITLLRDTRQDIRAGAAEWMGERQSDVFVKPLQKRLKTEKSDLAKAAMLTALEKLGEDLSAYVSPSVLTKEAEAGIKKAKLEKLNWLGLDHLPAVQFINGKRVSDVVLKWWIYLAFKLKDPGGNTLFQLYLKQLAPESREKFSLWILDSWVNYDTKRPSDEDGNAYAKKNAQARYDSVKRWYKDYSPEKAFADLKREFMGQYLNSGAASKGILALAAFAPPAIAADRGRSYLKQHGSRTSQASALLSMLAAKADPVSLQVVISAATRLKQKGVQAFANELLAKVADEKGWTLDELADRTIPTAGFDDDGVLELPCGPEEKLYTGILTEDLKIEIRNPDGKTIKNLSSNPDDATKASKKQLSTSKKELKQVVAMQSARLYEALCSGRIWLLEDWENNFVEHPIMRKLIERVVWLGEDKDGNAAGLFRPTAEGDYTNADDQDVNIKTMKAIRLAHGAALTDAQNKEWAEHLNDYEVTPLFVQFGRENKKIDPSDKESYLIEDREGWVTDSFTVRGIASKLGYERGEAIDGGYFNEYTKSFRSAGIMAVIEFSGNCLPEENVAAAMMSLTFVKLTRQGRPNLLFHINI